MITLQLQKISWSNNNFTIGLHPAVLRHQYTLCNPSSRLVWAHGQSWQTAQYGHMAIRGRQGKKAKKAAADRRRTGGLCVGVECHGRCTADSTPGCPFSVSVLSLAFRRRRPAAFFAFFPCLPRIAMCPY